MGERYEIKPIEVEVVGVIRETRDTVTLVLSADTDALTYRAGHFLTIDPHQFREIAGVTRSIEEVKGKREPPRAYSMSSEPYEHQLSFTVKEEVFIPGQTSFPPLLSPFLVHGVVPGRRMVVVGFTGPYTLPDDLESRTDQLVHLCAGSGIVPNFSILKHALRTRPRLRHTLLYANKTYEDVIFRGQLEDLERANPRRLRVIHTLSREQAAEMRGPSYRMGRIDREVIDATLEDLRNPVIFVCGPGITSFERRAARASGHAAAPRFLETILGYLAELKVDRSRIHYESYG